MRRLIIIILIAIGFWSARASAENETGIQAPKRPVTLAVAALAVKHIASFPALTPPAKGTLIISERAAIVVHGDRFEVLGDSKVAIYDNQRHDKLWYYWLSPGMFFDIRSRAVIGK